MRNLNLCIVVLGGALAASCAYPDVQVGSLAESGGAGGKGSIGGNGGAPAVGGSSKVGSTLTAGGTQSAGGASGAGGINANGGMVTLGGSTSTTGGVNSVGGKSSTGGTSNTTGTSATGGIVTTGGTMATVGGALSMGGTKSGGGSIAAGGTLSTGGTNSLSTGGTTPVATGGMKATGGITSAIVTGGAANTGGAATGGAATGGTPATGGAATGGAATGGYSATTGCPGTGGPSMVKLPQGYCIDSTEVTRDQYAAWLATNPTLPASSDANCGWKSTASYAADPTCMAGTAVCQGTAACVNQPQVCMDWCDAYAYCAGVGKRLCGKIGGGTNLYADYANASLSQWYNACSSGGANPNYPYVGAYQPTTCNGYDLGKGTTTVVGSLTGCQAPAPYAGVYDLSGNVWEWEDSCNGSGQSATCRIRGGAFVTYGGGSTLTCGNADYYYLTRVYVNGGIGFRCCSP